MHRRLRNKDHSQSLSHLHSATKLEHQRTLSKSKLSQEKGYR